MNISQKFYEKEFSNDSPKQAYLDACEWIAKNILSKSSKVEVTKIAWRIVKTSKDFPTFRLELFVAYDEEEVSSNVCSVCKELHSAFFVNEEYNCTRCNKEAYRKKLKTKLDTGCTWFNELISKMLEKYN